MNVNALPNLRDQKIEGETANCETEDTSKALIVKSVKAKEQDEADEEIVPWRATTREYAVAQATEKLASLFYISAGQSHTQEIKVGRMVATQTTPCGQAMSATNKDSKLIAVGLKNATWVAATVQSTPIS